MDPNLVSFVLKSPKNPGNIGASARALKNMGFEHLVIAAPRDEEWSVKDIRSHPDVTRMAYGAGEVVRGIRITRDLASAVEDASLVIGTSSKGLGRRVMTPREGACEAASLPDSERVAVVFGREDTGLTKRDIELCHFLVEIPASSRHPSLNLAQAVMILSYEFHLVSMEPNLSLNDARDHPPSAELEGMYAHMKEVLLDIGFLNPQNPDHILRTLRGLFGRARPDRREVSILRGMMSQVRWYCKSRSKKEK